LPNPALFRRTWEDIRPELLHIAPIVIAPRHLQIIEKALGMNAWAEMDELD
jgi:hypothetical protein